jgi:hypothetical protein
MTLVVARIEGSRIAVVSDTIITEGDRSLPYQRGIIKSCMLPGNICVSFANSPDLAARDFTKFAEQFPQGAGFADIVSFFEKSSAETNNDYIVAFGTVPRLVKISGGHRNSRLAKTLWIGDKVAYERFREYEAKYRKGVESGRAINGVFFADELPKSPASDLYSTMRHVVGDREISSVDGFVCTISNRNGAFRHSAYSDMLFNWPDDENDDFVLQLTDKIDFGASDENSDYSVTQISTGYLGLNLVAFYHLKGKKLFLFYGERNGLANKCLLQSNVQPAQIKQKLIEALKFDPNWLMMVMSAAPNSTRTLYRSGSQFEKDHGVGFAIQCHVNTFQKNT